MEHFLGLGNGSDGFVTLTSHSPIDASCNGTAGTTTVNATNASFAAGQYIKIIQMRGGNYGKMEINKIASYSAGVITTLNPLQYTYTNSGSDRAQVIVMPQYSGVVISSSFSIKAWNDLVGGHLTFLCTGRVINNSGVTVNGVGRGFRGGNRETTGSSPTNAEQGDSPTGAPGYSQSPNGLGGGGARDNGGGRGSSGGGAGNASTGNNGGSGDGQQGPGIGGSAIDTTSFLSRLIMGAGGGGGIGPGGNDRGGFGGPGGASFDIYCYEFVNNGTWDISGQIGNTNSQYGSYTDANDPNVGGSQGSGGGGGSGGDGRITCVKFTNNGGIYSVGGIGGHSNNNPPNPRGGNGSVGLLNIRCCSYTNNGSISPTPILQIGGHPFCGTAVQIM
jgi:hypothetical protein